MKLPDYVKKLISVLEAAGYEAYIVGSSARDSFIGKKPPEYELVTSAKPNKIKEVLSDRAAADRDGKRVKLTSLAVGSGGFESALKEELSRRDFTVNAIAYSPARGYVDPFFGRRDIAEKTVGTVGEPSEAFREDPSRILGMVRLCGELGFSAKENAQRAAELFAEKLNTLSPERTRDWFNAILLCDKAGSLMLKNKEIFFAVIPELRACDGFLQHNPNHCHDVLSHIAAAMDNIPAKLTLRLAALFHDIAKPDCFTLEGTRGRFWGHMEASEEMTRGIMERLRYPKKLTDRVCELVLWHDRPYDSSPESARRWLRDIGAENLYLIFRLKRADCLAHDRTYHRHLKRIAGFRRAVEAALKRGDCYSLSRLAVTARDISPLAGSSEKTGELLRFLLDEVIEGRAANSRDGLIALAKEKLSEKNA